MRNPPSHRYIRLRAVSGASMGQILAEVVNHLGLPGVPSATAVQRIHLLISDIPGFEEKKTGRGTLSIDSRVTGGHLRVVVDRTKPKKKGRPKKAKESPIFWLDGPPAYVLTIDEYKTRHGLDAYLTKAGDRRIRSACRIWMDHVAREIACGALLCGKDHKLIVDLLKKIAPKVAKVPKEPLRPVDVQSFQELFWDFDGWSQTEILSFLSSNSSCVYSQAAATKGLDAMLFRMGVGNMALDRAQMLRDVQSLAYLEIDKYRHTGVTNASDFQRYYTIMKDAFEQEDRYAIESEEVYEGDEFDTALEPFDAEPVPRYSEVLENITQANDLEAVAKAEELELITAHHAEVLREQIIREQALSGEDLDLLQTVRSLQYGDEGINEEELVNPGANLGERDDRVEGSVPDDGDFFDFVTKESGA